MSENISKEIRSTVTSEGNIELSITRVETPTPSDDEVLVKVEAAPINPSDLGLLLSFAADLSSISSSGSEDETVTSMKIHPALMASMKPRLDQSMQAGNEGAGVIIDAGENVKDLIAKQLDWQVVQCILNIDVCQQQVVWLWMKVHLQLRQHLLL